jgi:phosphate-selective porin OprO/OprP
MTAEYLADLVHSARVGTGPSLGTVTFQGFYVEGLVFLTGEHRGFDTNYYRRTRIIPKCNLGESGWGAWELGLRYQYLDLDEGGVRGGVLNNVTVGLNWYWNPNMKLQFNYDYAHRDGGTNPLASGQVHGFGTRVAFDF